MCERTVSCECQQAVTRTYRELRARGLGDVSAFYAAARVFCWHHPDVSPREARFAVAEWLDDAA